MKDLKGKTVVITGGSSGIGFALAETAHAEGMKIVITGRDAVKLEAATKRLRGFGAEVMAAVADIADEEAMNRFAADVYSRFGEVNLLCCNAGITCLQSVADMTLDDWNWVVTTNLGGTFNTLRVFLPRMFKQAGERHILYSGSMSSVYPPNVKGLSAYTASKMGILGLSAILDFEYASEVAQTFAIIGTTESSIASSAQQRFPGKSRERPSDESRGVKRLPASIVSRIMIDAVKAGRRYVATHKEREEGVAAFHREIIDSFQGVSIPAGG